MASEHSDRAMGSVRLFLRRRVTDFDEWRSRFERNLPDLPRSGVRGFTLCRALDDPNEIHLVLVFDSLENASRMAGQIDLPESHERALMAGALEIGSMWLAETVASREL
jgi:hypothetical protein